MRKRNSRALLLLKLSRAFSTESLRRGADVMTTIFGDFYYFRRKNGDFLEKPFYFCAPVAVSESK
jgi:hypothetical protein